MALTPLITASDLKARYGQLVANAGISNAAALTDLANGAIGLIRKQLGYNPQVDASTGLPSLTERLNGGRPVVELLAAPDLDSTGATIVVKELGLTLTRRGSFPTSTGDYFVGNEGYALYRLAGPGARQLGIWGANSPSSGVGVFGTSSSGGPRLEGDYTDQYRGVIEVTYTPDVNLPLLKSVALQLCRLELLLASPFTSVSTGNQSYSQANITDYQGSQAAILNQLPRPMLLGTGGY